MARSYAQFSTSMWRDPDFVALPAAWQRVYMMLTSQQDVSAVGVLHLSITRWANRAPDTTAADIVQALMGLMDNRFVIFDRGSEEVLLRSFLRRDNGYKNPKRLPAIKDAANEVESPTIVAALAVEFERLAIAAVYRGQCADIATGEQEALTDLTGQDLSSQVNSLSIGYPDSPDGLSASERRVPQPPTPNPQPIPPSAASASAPAAKQDTFAGMPEPPTPTETPTQVAFRLGRAWLKVRQNQNTPVTMRGRADPAVALSKLIEPTLAAGYTEDEINQALKNLNRGLPTASTFDDALAAIRTPRDPNDQGRGGSALARRGVPEQHRPSTAAARARQALDVAAQLDAKYANGVPR